MLDFLVKEYEEFRIVDVIGLDKENKVFNVLLGIYYDFEKILDKDFLDNLDNEFILEDIV